MKAISPALSQAAAVWGEHSLAAHECIDGHPICASAAKTRTTVALDPGRPPRLRRLQALVRLRLAHQGITLGVREGFDRQIDIKLRPLQVMGTEQLDVADLSNRSVLEPRRVLERDEQFLLPDEQPEAMRRHVGDFNRGSAWSKRCGFHYPQPF